MPSSINIEDIKNISITAGNAVMEIYCSDFSHTYKDDQTPLTLADLKANEIICTHLQSLYPNIPIMSEENQQIPYNKRKKWKYYWCIDPIDGTKEFIKKNDEFTINIALIKNNIPILGVVYAPALDKLYWGEVNNGAFLNNQKLPLKTIPSNQEYIILTSRSHTNQETLFFITQVQKKHPNNKIVEKGSSLKLCMIASGEASIYPKLGNTMEWDTAASDAILQSVGKSITHFYNQQPIGYNKKDLVNPYFIAK